MNCLCRPSRIMSVRINLLDETDFIHEIKDDLPGQALLDVVFARLNLIETSYFGIRYIDEENQTHWLDPASRISRQLKPKSDPYDLYFGVKFYAADPCKLLEEITRYQLFLQVKQDVLQGRLPVAFELAAELGAFVVQSELGDYDQRRHSKGYVSEFRLLPNQSSELETRVAELHQQLKGMSPASAELNYLDKVKWHDMYGVDLHPVLGEDSVEYFLGLTPSGIVVLRNKTTVAHYYWPRIAKVYYKGRYFMLRISDKNNELSTYGFETPRKSACKHLWRCCVEHHAFFRQVRVAPLPNSQSNTSDLFQLGSRFRYSRSEKHQASNESKDALAAGRTPPAFTRVPSKRQPRRVIDDFFNGGGNSNINNSSSGSSSRNNNGGNNNGGDASLLGKGSAIMTPNFESPYRSTYSIPTSLGIRPYHQQSTGGGSSSYNNNGGVGGGGSNLQTPDSPRSTRSAPWPRSQQRSLFGHNPSSPRSVRSASTTGGGHHHHHHHHHHHQHNQQQHNNQPHHHHQQQQQQRQQRASSSTSASQQRYRSSSVESHSSNDSRSTRRHKHRHRRTSDNESELSRGSGRSGRSHHRKHRRSHRHRRDSASGGGTGGGSDHDSTRGRSYSGHRSSSMRSGGSAELIDSTSQWREVQRRQAEASLGQSSVQQASVSKSSMVARSLHSNDSHSDTHSHHKSRRHRKNKSPSESRNRSVWSSELAKHLQFDLVDTTGMTEDQLREIPYTVVETNSKRANSNLKIHKSGSKSSVGAKSTGSGNTITNGSGSAGGQGKNRVDRIRGLYYQSSTPHENGGTKNGSIRSASTISSRECERNNGLVRMMSSMSMGDFISPTGSNLSPLENSALRVSHEHTDSGLGADQDYAYSSERSSDSTRYGTNKSSGASSGSHRKSAGAASSGSAYNSLMQQTVSNQQQQLQQRQNTYFAQRQQQQQSHQQQQRNSQTNQHQNQHKSLAPIHNSPHSKQSSTTAGAATNNTGTTANNRLLNYTTFENNQYKFSLNNVFGKGATGGSHSNLGGAATSAGAVGGGGGTASSINGCNNGSGGGGGGFANNTNKQQQQQQRHLDSLVEWPSMPNRPAAPYYYNGPPTSAHCHVKKRDAKSDIGVPTRRMSGQSLTKTQLLSGQLANASCYPMHPSAEVATSSSSAHIAGYMRAGAMATGNYNCGLQPAKSDLFLSYIHGAAPSDYERPYIYNYKMPNMPEFLRSPKQQQQQQQQPQQPQQQAQYSGGGNAATAYHISGAQTADPPPLYGGTAPATDVMYYQFDNGKATSATSAQAIVQQPKSLLNKATNSQQSSLATTTAATTGTSSVVGPLVYLQHGQNVAPSNVTSTQQTCTNSNNNNNNNNNNNVSTQHAAILQSSCSEDELQEQFLVSAEITENAAAHYQDNYVEDVRELPTTDDDDEDDEEEDDDDDDDVDYVEYDEDAAAVAAEAEDIFDANAPMLMSPTGSANGNVNYANNRNSGGNSNNNNAPKPLHNAATTTAYNFPISANVIASTASTSTTTYTSVSVSALANINLDNCNTNANTFIPKNNNNNNNNSSNNNSTNTHSNNNYNNSNTYPHPNPNPLPSSSNSKTHNSSTAPTMPPQQATTVPSLNAMQCNTLSVTSHSSTQNTNSNTNSNIVTSTATTTVSATGTATINTNRMHLNTNSNLLQNQNISSSLEIILSPIIQSSRRAQ